MPAILHSATTYFVTTAPLEIQPDIESASGSGWGVVRADDSIQFAPVPPKPPPEPPPPRDPNESNWLEDFNRWLQELMSQFDWNVGSAWPVLKWVLLAGIVALALILLWKLLSPLFTGPKKASLDPVEDWVPDQSEAMGLLVDADRLAGEGRYDEATHLLLQRSVSQIAEARSDWVDPSSTARELASLPALPAAARTAFGTIAERVERSLFALQKLSEDDWRAARSAYAKFALQPLVEGN